MRRSCWVLALGLAFTACDNGANGNFDEPPSDDTGAGGAAEKGVLGHARRLTHFEYNNTVRDLLGDTTQPANSFPDDQQIGIFDNNAAAGTVSTLLADHYLDAADGLATRALAKFESFVGCPEAPAAEAESKCAADFITAFGRRAYRRALAKDEVAHFVSLFGEVRKAATFATGIQAVLEAMLVSPYFLLRPEFGRGGADATSVPLTGYEIASRLSYALWGSMPDDALLDAAEQHQLDTPEHIADQARRLLADKRAQPAVAAFYAQWFDLKAVAAIAKDSAVYPNFDDTTKAAMVAETKRFIDSVIWEGDGKLSTLLTAPYSFLNASLAPIYGIAGITGQGLVKTELNPAQRAGILTQPSVLAHLAKSNETSPTKRGDFVLSRFLCRTLSPPPNTGTLMPPTDGATTTRERLAAHTANPSCAGCHKQIDGIGFGLENYDAVGKWRTMDNGGPVDAAGALANTVDIDGPYTGGVELAKKLAKSAQVRDCAATQWFRYVYGRVETSDDAADLDALKHSFAASNGNLKDLIVQIAQMPNFAVYHRPSK